MKLKIISIIISVIYLLVSFLLLHKLSLENTMNPIVYFFLLPSIIAGIFRFGSGDIWFYFILIFETAILSFFNYLFLIIIFKCGVFLHGLKKHERKNK